MVEVLVDTHHHSKVVLSNPLLVQVDTILRALRLRHQVIPLSLCLWVRLTTADSNTPKPQYPPQSGPQPFAYAPQAPPTQPQQPHHPHNDLRRPSGGQRPPSSDPYSHRPQSTYDNPQELSTTSYTSPTDSRPQNYPQHIQPSQPQDEYSPSVYSPTDGPPHQQSQPFGGQQAPYPHTPHSPPQPSQTQQPYTSYNPPQPSQPAPSAPSAPSPSFGQNPYPVLNSGPPAGQYQAYHAPREQQPGYVAEAGGNPDGFYR